MLGGSFSNTQTPSRHSRSRRRCWVERWVWLEWKKAEEGKRKSSAGICDEHVYYASFIRQSAHNDSLASLVPVISRPLLSLRFFLCIFFLLWCYSVICSPSDSICALVKDFCGCACVLACFWLWPDSTGTPSDWRMATGTVWSYLTQPNEMKLYLEKKSQVLLFSFVLSSPLTNARNRCSAISGLSLHCTTHSSFSCPVSARTDIGMHLFVHGALSLISNNTYVSTETQQHVRTTSLSKPPLLQRMLIRPPRVEVFNSVKSYNVVFFSFIFFHALHLLVLFFSLASCQHT